MKKFLMLVAMIVIMCCPGCMYAIRYDGEYKGKVVDSDTREPIEGVVVLGVWYTITPTVAGGVSNYYDAREIQTDKNGEFTIQGMGLRILSNLPPMDIMMFKSGYSYLGLTTWNEVIKSYKLDDDKTIFYLKKLTINDRKKRSLPQYPPTEVVHNHKANLFLNEIRKERIEQGLKAIN